MPLHSYPDLSRSLSGWCWIGSFTALYVCRHVSSMPQIHIHMTKLDCQTYTLNILTIRYVLHVLLLPDNKLNVELIRNGWKFLVCSHHQIDLCVASHQHAFSVFGLFLLETAQTIMVTNDAFQWFAYGFGNLIMLSKPFTSSVDAPIMDGLVALIVQLFFSWRIWVSISIGEECHDQHLLSDTPVLEQIKSFGRCHWIGTTIAMSSGFPTSTLKQQQHGRFLWRSGLARWRAA